MSKRIAWNKGLTGIKTSDKGNTAWNKGLTKETDERVLLIAKNRLGKPLSEEHRKSLSVKHTRSSNGMLGKKHSLETKRKISLSAGKGENHHRWIKDRTKLAKRQERNDMAYKEWRRLVKVRDKFKCRVSSEKCEGEIVVHHILTWAKYPELRYKITNGITLCRAHHPRMRAEENRLAPLFIQLVSESK